MRILHLSDLHLGKRIMDMSLIEDQRYILNDIINIIKDKKIDIVLICGDVYDKSVPSIEAVNLFDDFLTELSDLNVNVLIIAGNHDSKDRLCFGKSLFEGSNIYIEGGYSGSLRKVSFRDEFGFINFYMLPFLTPNVVKRVLSDVSCDTYDDMVRSILDRESFNFEERNVILSHQNVLGGYSDLKECDGIVSLGGVDSIDASCFSKFDYVALGHIHRMMNVFSDNVWYSGSPLSYSFSDVCYDRGVLFVDIKDKGCVSVEKVILKPIREMRVIRGPLKMLLDKSVYSISNVDDYISAIITDDDVVIDAIGKLRRVYKNILEIRYDNIRNNEVIDDDNFVDIKSKSEIELFGDFYFSQNNMVLNDDKMRVMLDVIKNVKGE